MTPLCLRADQPEPKAGSLRDSHGGRSSLEVGFCGPPDFGALQSWPGAMALTKHCQNVAIDDQKMMNNVIMVVTKK